MPVNALKHKVSDRYEEDVAGRSGSFTSVASLVSKHSRGEAGEAEAGYPTGAAGHQVHAFMAGSRGGSARARGEPRGRMPLAHLVGFVLAGLLVVELMVIMGLATGPTLQLMRSLDRSLTKAGEGIPVSLDVHMEGGEGFEQIFSEANRQALANATRGVVQQGSALIGPLIGGKQATPAAAPDPSEAEAVAGPAGEATVQAIPEPPPSALAGAVAESLFVRWCLASPCMSGRGEGACLEVDKKLLSARSEDGAPLIPLPPEFCEGVGDLNAAGCLCDEDLARPEVVGDSAQLVETAFLLGTLCGIDDLVAPSSGNCP